MLHAQQGSTFLEPEANTPTVEHEESDSDGDIPCFFDIEAMVNLNNCVWAIYYDILILFNYEFLPPIIS
jgi:hypothetical protein